MWQPFQEREGLPTVAQAQWRVAAAITHSRMWSADRASGPNVKEGHGGLQPPECLGAGRSPDAREPVGLAGFPEEIYIVVC
ncbi:hypothetical protein FKM82_030642 [Ascaphus truei]